MNSSNIVAEFKKIEDIDENEFELEFINLYFDCILARIGDYIKKTNHSRNYFNKIIVNKKTIHIKEFEKYKNAIINKFSIIRFGYLKPNEKKYYDLNKEEPGIIIYTYPKSKINSIEFLNGLEKDFPDYNKYFIKIK